MTVPAKLALFALALVVVFVAAFGAGRAVGPEDDSGGDHGRHPGIGSSTTG